MSKHSDEKVLKSTQSPDLDDTIYTFEKHCYGFLDLISSIQPEEPPGFSQSLEPTDVSSIAGQVRIFADQITQLQRIVSSYHELGMKMAHLLDTAQVDPERVVLYTRSVLNFVI